MTHNTRVEMMETIIRLLKSYGPDRFLPGEYQRALTIAENRLAKELVEQLIQSANEKAQNDSH